MLPSAEAVLPEGLPTGDHPQPYLHHCQQSGSPTEVRNTGDSSGQIVKSDYFKRVKACCNLGTLEKDLGISDCSLQLLSGVGGAGLVESS